MSLGYQRNVAQQLLLDKHNDGYTNLDAYLKIANITANLVDPCFWHNLAENIGKVVVAISEAFVNFAVGIRQAKEEMLLTWIERARENNENSGD
jgi:hypothetical protein